MLCADWPSRVWPFLIEASRVRRQRRVEAFWLKDNVLHEGRA